MTKQEFYHQQAPAFNFELDAEQILTLALERGVIREVSEDNYEYTENWTD